MNLTTTAANAEPSPSSGKPPEIELWTNRHIVHPLARRLTNGLIATRVTPNQVSGLGVIAAACAAGAYTLLAWPLGAFVGFALHIGWHVLDGADGDLARRTGRSSPSGEVVDGICDYVGHLILYAALATILARQIGAWAYLIALASGAARAVQANSYESRRRIYQHWMQGKPWLRQTVLAGRGSAGDDSQIDRRLQGLARVYIAVSSRVTAQNPKLDAALESKLSGDRDMVAKTRSSYRKHQAPTLRRSYLLSANSRTAALFISMLAGSPLYFFGYELIFLSLIMIAVLFQQQHDDSALLHALDEI